MTEPTLVYNRDEAEKFLNSFGLNEYFMFQTFDDNEDKENKNKQLTRQFYGNLNAHINQLAELNNQGAGIYITVNKTDGKGRKAKNITAIRAFFVDLDGTPLPTRFHLPPSIITETSPGRYHIYWLIRGCELEQFTEIQQRLIPLYFGDKAIHDLPRVMRLPGFMHRKHKPFMSRNMHVSDITYDYSYFVDCLPASKKPTEKQTDAATSQSTASHHQFKDLNSHALSRLDAWVPMLFPHAARSSLGWRVNSKSLGRNLQEDISFTSEGIVDFGIHDQGDSNAGKRTPIDIVKEWNHCDFKGAVTWLHRILGLPAPVWETDNKAKAKTIQLEIAKLFPIIEEAIPIRPWLVPGLLLRRSLTLTAAPGGTGKSILTLCVAIMCALGTPWADWRPRDKYRVLIINAEEDIEEQQRRAFAVAARSMNVSDNVILQDNILVANNPTDIVVARFNPRTRNMTREPLADQFIKVVRENQIDIVIVDPFAETFEGEETNSELKYVGALWRDIARQTNTAVWLIHHTKKYASEMAGDIEASRGGTALGNIARIGTTMFPMTKDEAALLGIDQQDRLRYIRFDDAKANYHMQSAKAQWFHSETCHLQNQQGDIPGDNVGIFIPWGAPSIGGVDPAKLMEMVALIDKGIYDTHGVFLGEYYTLNKNQKADDSFNRWVGLLLCRELKCSDAQAAQLITEMKNKNMLVEFSYKGPRQRKSTKGCGSMGKKLAMEQPPDAQSSMYT